MSKQADNVFLEAVSRTLAHEGGYVDDPDDRGGETNLGITVRTARSAGYVGSMQNLTKDDAISIYKKLYWDQPKLNKVADIVPNLAGYLFDIGVNMGPQTAIKLLQNAITMVKPTPTLIHDGIIGPKTLGWIEGLSMSEKRTLMVFVGYLHTHYYLDIIEHNPKQRKYVNGWMSRIRVN